MFVAACLSLFVGCGGPKLVPVKGTVTLDGTPLPYKSLLFTPEPGTPDNGAGGYTDGEGKYSLTAVLYGVTKDMEGIQPGRYRVTVSEPMIPISEADFVGSPEDEDPEAAGTIIDPDTPSQEIPAVYSSAETTPLVLDVPEEGGVLDIELKSKSNSE